MSQWSSFLVAREYARVREGWSDPGEERLFRELLPLARGTRVLDIGVGGGRTTSFLAYPTAEVQYVGIDSSPRMVRLAARNHPDAAFRLGDATDLSGYADASIDLVVFSLNGVDCLDHTQRVGFFAAAHRILCPGGVLVFSTHNLDGPSYQQRPRGRQVKEALNRPGLTATLGALPGAAVRLAQSHWFYRRSAPRSVAAGDWALAPLRAHEFRFVAHFARFGAAVRDLEQCGLRVQQAWTTGGEPIATDQARHDDHYAHILSRKPAG